MPRGDGTGPNGLGPMTGRGAGYCVGYTVPGYMNPGGLGCGRAWGRGGGMGRGMALGFRGGFGRGMGWRANPGLMYDPTPVDAVQEKNVLKGQIEQLKETLAQLEGRLAGMEAQRGEASAGD